MLLYIFEFIKWDERVEMQGVEKYLLFHFIP
jgi:hypothetical protein